MISARDWLDQVVIIDPNNATVFIGDCKVPGLIERGGIRVIPGDRGDCNRIAIDFLVGKVVVLPDE